MSNFLAIATVTSTLRQQLQGAASAAVPGATVSTGRPESAQNGTPDPMVNVYLYQILPNAALRNADLPTRRSDSSLSQRPKAALDLYYLLSFYGSDTQLEPQRLLGSAVSALHSKPLLTGDSIRATITAATDADPDHFLSTSDLADQVETIKFPPFPLNLEERSKLWSVFFQTPYALSVAYQAAVVLLEEKVSPQSVLPVTEPLVFAATFRQPLIEQVVPETGQNMPILFGSTLNIRGQMLRGETTQVRIGQAETTPASEDIRDTRISISLDSPPFPDESLRAGVQGAQVFHSKMMGKPATLHPSVESNAVPLVLRPTITSVSLSDVQESGSDPISANMAVQVSPTVGSEQRVVLLLNEQSNDSPEAYTFLSPSRDADSDSVTIAVSGVKAAPYLVRLQVDGAESVLERDTDSNSPTFNQYTAPTIRIGNWLVSTAVDVSHRGNRIVARVTVVDSNGEDVRDAAVSGTWTLSDSSTRDRTVSTNRGGIASFLTRVSNPSGTYTFLVTDISKPEYVFDMDSSILTGEITV